MTPVSQEFRRGRLLPSTIATCLLAATPATAQLNVHPVILDLAPDQLQRSDLELENSSSERLYVVIEPARIDNPGSSGESRVSPADPEELGLLASPPRLVLEPGERRFLRVAALAPPGDRDRIFRVTVKPVQGEVTGEQTGVKVLIGYDVLVIQRPENLVPGLSWTREGGTLTVRNTGNTNVELIRGRQCPSGQDDDACTELRPVRLYAGNETTIATEAGAAISYTAKVAGKVDSVALDSARGTFP